MAGSQFVDVCRFNPTLGGTTDWTYSSAVTGYNSPALAGIVNGTLYSYRAEDATLSQWEVGQGAYNTGTGVLARTTVLYNSSGTGSGAGQSGAGTKISFSTVPQVAIVALKEDVAPINTPTLTGTTTLSGGSSDTLVVGNTATSNALTVNSQGDIGVGTLLTPDASHHLSFEIIRNTTSDAAFTLRNRNDGAGTRAVLHFFAGTSDQMDASIDVASVAGGAAVNWRTGTGATGGFNILQAANGPINFYTNNTITMSLAATPALTIGVAGSSSGSILLAKSGGGSVTVTASGSGVSLGGAVVDNAAWTTYTPTPTSGAGSFTSVSSSGAYKVIGKSVFFTITITITTAGTASGNIIVALPTGTAQRACSGAAKETVVNGNIGSYFFGAGATSMNINGQASASLIASGVVLTMSGVYEIQ